MVSYRHNEWYYKLTPSALGEDVLHVMSFEGEEQISRLFEYRFDLLSKEPDLDPAEILNKAATFQLNRGRDADPIEIHGIVSHFEQHGRSPDYVFYRAVLVPKFWRLTLNFQSVVYQEMDVEQLVTRVLEEAGLVKEIDFTFDLDGTTFPTMEYVVQYRETDFDFVNRRLEHFGIYYYFDHRDGTDMVVFTNSNDKIPAIEQEDDILYNPGHEKLTESEVITDLTFQQQVVTGLVKLNDYNYRYPGNSLLVEHQIDAEAPGMYYEYGDHYKDTDEGGLLAQIRNEEIVAASKIFSGKSDSRLFQAGYSFKMGMHYREEWNTKYILTSVRSRGDQRTLFAYMPPEGGKITTYENVFTAIPEEHVYRPPRITPVPRIHGIMTARMESGNDDEYAYLDDQGRYKVKVPFDLGDKTNGEASRQIRMSQPYSGPDYGMHFPNHKDTEMLWSAVDGDPDRILGLGTLPNPHNPTPSTSANKAQSVIRTAGQHELHFDDTTGSENIFLHSTKDWTIDIVNDKNQVVGHDETLQVGNDQSITIGANQTIDVGSDRAKTVGANQSESVSEDKSITVGGNHTESIGADETISVGGNESVTIGKNQTLSVSDNQTVDVGKNQSQTIGKDASQNVGDNWTLNVGKDGEMVIGKKTKIQSGDDLTITGNKKAVITIKDQLTLKCGKAEIIMKKNGDIQIKGAKINVKGSGDVKIKGSKIAEN